MLTDTQRAIVKSTIPLLETGGEALTTRFYRILLGEHPDVRPLFNPAHQASGAQPRALANSVLMYARHLDHLDRLGDLPAQIINKHVSLQVQPEQYAIVGSCLLRAMREVLGAETATDEVLAAWGAAYQQLADILIAAEESVYAAAAAASGGWRGVRVFRVRHRQVESSEITSFYLRPDDGGPVIQHQAGQYLGLRLQIDGTEHRRNYSLSSTANGQELRISVKREPGGKVSCYLHDQVQVGDLLDVFPPAGHFTLASGDKPVVLISGGVGITPMLPLAISALENKRTVHFIHCARSREVHAFRDTVDALSRQYPQLRRFYCYESADDADGADALGRLDTARLEKWLAPLSDIDAYFIGPQPFMAGVRRDLLSLGVPESRMHYEFFGPTSALT